MILKVDLYCDSPLFYHKCTDEAGKNHRVDLLVNGDLEKGTTPESLVSKTVEVDYVYPYVEIAMNVRIAATPPAKNVEAM